MTGYESKRAAAQDKLAQESVVERAWFTIDELNAWADKKLVENPHWVMPAEEPERKEALEQPAQKPVGFVDSKLNPIQRPWVEPMGNEWFEWWRVSAIADSTEAEIDFADFLIIAQAVSAKLKELNNG